MIGLYDEGLIEVSSLFSNYIFARIVWVFGLVFLVLTLAFGGISKVMYPMILETVKTEGVQQFIGVLQILTAVLLVWKPYRRWGITLSGLNFLVWVIWFNTTDVSMVLFCLVGLSVAYMLLFCKFNFYPPNKEWEPSIEEMATGTVFVESDAEVEIIKDPPKESLWMDGLDKDGLMKWVFGDDN